ncbi:MAG TPA: hypothetical protein VIX19_14480 [Terriglobales bacterium]
MKRLSVFVSAMLLVGCLAFAQTGTGSSASTAPKATNTPAAESGKKATKTSKAHKGGKKSKKSTGTGTATTPPK